MTREASPLTGHRAQRIQLLIEERAVSGALFHHLLADRARRRFHLALRAAATRAIGGPTRDRSVSR